MNRALELLRGILASLDRGMDSYAALFGTRFSDPYARYGSLVLAYGSIYAIAIFLPGVLALLALSLGYLGVLSVGRAWVRNEKLRSKIAKKLEDLDPDSLPELRLAALLSLIQFVVLVPLLLESAHTLFDLYEVPTGASRKTWIAFGADLLGRSILDWAEVYEMNLSSIHYESQAGRHLVMFILITMDIILIQGLIRLLAIHKTIQDGVAVTRKDPEIAGRLGRRAVKPLAVLAMQAEGDTQTRQSALQALGMIADTRGCKAMLTCLRQPTLHTTAVAALVRVGHVAPLIKAVQHPAAAVRRGAANALGRLGYADCVDALQSLLQDSEQDVRTTAVEALSRIEGQSAQAPLLTATQDSDASIRCSALRHIAAREGEVALRALLAAMQDEQSDVRLVATELLARFPDGLVVPVLSAARQDEDERVRKMADRSLLHLNKLVKAGRT
jgi:HEAT repeat protein